SGLLDGANDLLGPLAAAAQRADGCAGPGQASCHGSAEHTGGAGDDRDLPLEAEQILQIRSCRALTLVHVHFSPSRPDRKPPISDYVRPVGTRRPIISQTHVIHIEETLCSSTSKRTTLPVCGRSSVRTTRRPSSWSSR